MTTLRKELIQKIKEVLNAYIATGQGYLGEEIPETVVEQLADSILELRALGGKPKIDLSKSDPAWSILFNKPIDTSANILAKEAMDAFEVAFDGMKIPWGETKDWKEFQDFVVRVYTQDKTERRKNGNCWTDYCLWRKNEGQYGKAMTNLAIRRRPRDFMDVAWPTFLAHSAMYGKKTVEPDLDDSGAPISY